MGGLRAAKVRDHTGDHNPVAPTLYPIFARSQSLACGSCGEAIYWTVASITGLNVAVSLIGPDAVAPTKHHNGMGTLHHCARPFRKRKQPREMAPL